MCKTSTYSGKAEENFGEKLIFKNISLIFLTPVLIWYSVEAS